MEAKEEYRHYPPEPFNNIQVIPTIREKGVNQCSVYTRGGQHKHISFGGYEILDNKNMLAGVIIALSDIDATDKEIAVLSAWCERMLKYPEALLNPEVIEETVEDWSHDLIYKTAAWAKNYAHILK